MSGRAMMAALTTPGLSQTANRLYVYFVGRANGARVTWPSGKDISNDLGLKSRQTIADGIAELVKLGLIAVKRRFGDTSRYTILDPDGSIYEGEKMAEIPVVHVSAQQQDVQLSAQQDNPADLQPAQLSIFMDNRCPDSGQESFLQESPSKQVATELRSVTAAEPPSPLVDIRKLCFDEGKLILRRLTGHPPRAAGSLIAKFLKDHANHDAGAVLASMRACEEERPLDPVPWIVNAIRCRVDPALKFKDPAVALSYNAGLLAPDRRQQFRDGLVTDYSAFNSGAAGNAD
jgi:hypothetical protein